jgi:hypothetical protein
MRRRDNLWLIGIAARHEWIVGWYLVVDEEGKTVQVDLKMDARGRVRAAGRRVDDCGSLYNLSSSINQQYLHQTSIYPKYGSVGLQLDNGKSRSLERISK